MSKKEDIWNHLTAGLSITPIEALDKYGCMSLSQRVGQLKREKFDWLMEHKKYIETELHNGSGYATYWLEDRKARDICPTCKGDRELIFRSAPSIATMCPTCKGTGYDATERAA